MTPKKIIVDGVGGVKLSSDAALDKWLEKKGVDCVFDAEDGYQVVDFESLVDGGKYTVTPPRQQEHETLLEDTNKIKQTVRRKAAARPSTTPTSSRRSHRHNSYGQWFSLPSFSSMIQFLVFYTVTVWLTIIHLHAQIKTDDRVAIFTAERNLKSSRAPPTINHENSDGHVTVPMYRLNPEFEKIHQEIDNENLTTKCARYGYSYDVSSPGTPRRIFLGSLLADDNWDLFEMHAAEAYGVYHQMIYIESNATQYKVPRELRFGPESQLRHNLVQSQMFGPSTEVLVDYYLDEDPDALNLIREALMREKIQHVWMQHPSLNQNDLFMVTDADEFFSRDFLRALQHCEIPQFGPGFSTCQRPKVSSTTITFEISPACIKKKRWYHPDVISGQCLEGLGDSADRPKPDRDFKQDRGNRLVEWGRDSANNFPESVLANNWYPLYNAVDIRGVQGGINRRTNYVSTPGEGKENAWGSGYHFHNWFKDMESLRFKYQTYGHPVSNIDKKTLSEISEDIDILVRCVRGLLNEANPTKKEYYDQGYDHVGGNRPIYFSNEEYRKRRHEAVVAAVKNDEARYGASYTKDGKFTGKLKSKPAKAQKAVALKETRPFEVTDRDQMTSDESLALTKHYREIRSNYTQLRLDERNDVDMSGFATVMGMGTKLVLRDFRRFVGSLRKGGFRGAIIIGIEKKAPQEVFDYLSSKGVITKIIALTNCTYKPFTGKEANKLGLHVCGEPYPDVKLRWLKFPLGRDWLNECGARCSGPVLLADVRDMFFQGNPFGQGAPKVEGLQVFEEHPDLRTTNWLTVWPIGDCKGKDKLFDEPMLCSGSVIGTREAMMDYLNKMYDEMKLWLSQDRCRFTTFADDQSIHNWLFYSNQLKNAKAIRNREGIVHTVGYEGNQIRKANVRDYMLHMDITEDEANKIPFRGDDGVNWLSIEEFGLTNKEGKLTNYDGSISPVVHQWDRLGAQFVKWINRQDFLSG